jgi:hypothetical protein
MRFHICFAILVVLLGSTASADIYKCVSEDGIVKFSDEPCSKKAEVAFKTDGQNFDAVIGNASPYPKLPVPESQFDTEKIVAHAKKIGRCIITGEYNNEVLHHPYPNPARSEYYVELHFGPKSDKKRFEVHMIYRTEYQYKGMYMWLDKIFISKKGKSYDPPSMADVQTFKKMGVGKWEIQRR